MVAALQICGSSREGKCTRRLEFYAEVESDAEKMILERKSCPFYDNGACKIKQGIISNYTTDYSQKRTYQRIEGKLVEIEKPFCDVLRAEKKR